MSSVEQIKAIEKEITRRKQLEMSLERVTRQNKLILNAAGEGIYGLDLNGHTNSYRILILYVNHNIILMH